MLQQSSLYHKTSFNEVSLFSAAHVFIQVFSMNKINPSVYWKNINSNKGQPTMKCHNRTDKTIIAGSHSRVSRIYSFTWTILPDTWNYIFFFLRKVTHFQKTSCSQAILQNETQHVGSLQKHACMWCEYMNVAALCFHRRHSLTWRICSPVVYWQTHLHSRETKPVSDQVWGFYH